MPRPIETELRIGTSRRVAIGTETRYIMGSAEGPWWFKFSWWVIPLGLLLILGPWALILRRGGTDNASAPVAPQPQVIYVPPAPVAQPAPSPQRELTPEERAEQYKEERRRQYGVR